MQDQWIELLETIRPPDKNVDLKATTDVRICTSNMNTVREMVPEVIYLQWRLAFVYKQVSYKPAFSSRCS